MILMEVYRLKFSWCTWTCACLPNKMTIEMHEHDERLSSVDDENNINTEKADEIGETRSSLQESDEIVCNISPDFETHSETHVQQDDSLFSVNECESAGKDEDPCLSNLSSLAFRDCIAHHGIGNST